MNVFQILNTLGKGYNSAHVSTEVLCDFFFANKRYLGTNSGYNEKYMNMCLEYGLPLNCPNTLKMARVSSASVFISLPLVCKYKTRTLTYPMPVSCTMVCLKPVFVHVHNSYS